MSAPLTAPAPPCVAIEIGGTKLQLAVGTSAGEILDRRRFAVDPAGGAAGIRNQITAALPGFVGQWRPAAVGVGYGGPVDRRTGRIVKSHHVSGWDEFPLGEWLADVEINVDGRRAYLWVAPAPAAGLWRLAGAPPFADGVMELQQTFQSVYGQVRINERGGAVMETELTGPDFTFALRDAAGVRWGVSARFEGDRLVGTATNPDGKPVGFLGLRDGPAGPMDGPPPP